MPRLYADENIPTRLVEVLRGHGHDVLTATEDGRANKKIPDDQVLSRATELERVVLTMDRHDYRVLHRASQDHAGILACTDDSDTEALACRIAAALAACPAHSGELLTVVRPSR